MPEPPRRVLAADDPAGAREITPTRHNERGLS